MEEMNSVQLLSEMKFKVMVSNLFHIFSLRWEAWVHKIPFLGGENYLGVSYLPATHYFKFPAEKK